MKIGVIGGGVSGLVAAHLLSETHEVELLEANAKVGGHTNTEDVDLSGASYRINTGFIVFNEPNYPNFLKLLKRLGVAYQPAPMSFSVKCERTGLEYGFETLNALFAQRRNLLSPRFLRMLLEIRRFRGQFESILEQTSSESETLGDYLKAQGFSDMFINQFLIPFGAAIWSADPEGMGTFPLKTFVRFFKHHGFLADGELLQWQTVSGGSDRYIEALTKPFADKIYVGAQVDRVVRDAASVRVYTHDGVEREYDRVVIAAHSDQALKMLESPTDAEREVLGAMGYQPNDVVLHTDTSVLPAHQQTWSSWNYRVPDEESARCTVTYDMNILQALESRHEFLVSLNMSGSIDPSRTIRRFNYEHPVFTPGAIQAQGKFNAINGVDRIHFAGAYWGYGFHEDGVESALAACAPLGGVL